MANAMEEDVENGFNGRSQAFDAESAANRLKVTDVNSCLTCYLCHGYLIDAVAITDCLHTFCRTCILRHLREEANCPVCNQEVWTTPPNCNLLSDRKLQDIVYRLVPGLYKEETNRRRRFLLGNFGRESTEKLNNSVPNIFSTTSVTDHLPPISLILERTVCMQSTSDQQPHVDSTTDHVYLLCSPSVTVSVLKKLICHKMSLTSDYIDYTVCVYHTDEFLKDYYSVLDIAEMYNWRMTSPLNLFFTILKENESSSSISEVLSRHEIRPPKVDSKSLVKFALKKSNTKKRNKKHHHGDSLKSSISSNIEKLGPGEICDSVVPQKNGGNQGFEKKKKMLSPKRLSRCNQRFRAFSESNSEDNDTISSVSVNTSNSFTEMNTSECYHSQHLKSMSKKEMLLTKLYMQSPRNLKVVSSKYRTKDDNDSIPSPRVDARCASYDSNSISQCGNSHFNQNINTNSMLPFKKRRRTSLIGNEEELSSCKADRTGTLTPIVDKTARPHAAGLPFRIYEDPAKNQLPKVGVVIYRGRAMTLQDRQKMLCDSSSKSNIMKPHKMSSSVSMCYERDSGSENLGADRTTCLKRKRESNEHEVTSSVQLPHSESNLSKTMTPAGRKSALRVRGNTPIK